MNAAQFMLALCGLVTMYLALDARPARRRLAPWVGLAGQPFWLFESWGLWGMFAASIGYTALYLRGAFWPRKPSEALASMRECLRRLETEHAGAWPAEALVELIQLKRVLVTLELER